MEVERKKNVCGPNFCHSFLECGPTYILRGQDKLSLDFHFVLKYLSSLPIPLNISISFSQFQQSKHFQSNATIRFIETQFISALLCAYDVDKGTYRNFCTN